MRPGVHIQHVFKCVCREHNQSAEDEQTYQNWVKTMKSINNNIQNLTRVSFTVNTYYLFYIFFQS